MVSHEAVAAGVVIAFVVASSVAALSRRGDWLLVLAFWALTLGGLNVYFAGTLWLPFKIVGYAALVHILLASLFVRSKPLLRMPMVVHAMALAWCSAALVAYIVPHPLQVDTGTAIQQAKWRPLAQLVTHMSWIALLMTAMGEMADEGRRRRVLRAALYAAVGAGIGAAVHFAFILAGAPFLPILRAQGEHSVVAAFEYAGSVHHRLYGLSGEPKSLAVAVLPGIPLAWWRAVEAGGNLPQARALWGAVSALLGLVAVATASTAAIIAMAVGLLWMLASRTFRHRRTSALISTMAVALVATSLPSSQAINQLSVVEMVEARTTVRLLTEGRDRRETAVIEYLAEGGPWLWLAGVGLGALPYHIPGMTHSAGVDPLDSGWLTLLAETGLLGASVVVWLVCHVLHGLRIAHRRRPQAAVGCSALSAAVVLLGAMHLGWGVLGLLLCWIGVGLGIQSRVSRMESSGCSLEWGTRTRALRPKVIRNL